MSDNERQCRVNGEEAMLALGRALGRELAAGGTLYLSGELGAGKTTLCRGILHALGHNGAVKSPTYTLVEPYRLNGISLYHFDLYRLDDPEELEFMGVRDYFAEPGIFLVEWPERGSGFLPPPDLTVEIALAGNGRCVKLTATGAKGHALLQGLVS